MQRTRMTFKHQSMRWLKIFSSIIIIWGLLTLIFNHLFFNVSISEPQGYYFVTSIGQISRGDKVLLCVNDQNSTKIMHQLKLPHEKNACDFETPYLLKSIAGIPGDKIKITTYGVFINGYLAPNSIALNFFENIALNPLPFGEFILGQDEYFMLGRTPHSYDSRYFGKVKKTQIIYKAYFLWKKTKPLLM